MNWTAGGSQTHSARTISQKTPSLFKRYPKRALFIVTAECAMFCRFCNRRRLVGKGFDAAESRDASLEYLAHSPDISEVILSGGDPLMLEPDELGFILHRLRQMRHIRVIRLSSRMPVVFPERAHRSSQALAQVRTFVVRPSHKSPPGDNR